MRFQVFKTVTEFQVFKTITEFLKLVVHPSVTNYVTILKTSNRIHIYKYFLEVFNYILGHLQQFVANLLQIEHGKIEIIIIQQYKPIIIYINIYVYLPRYILQLIQSYI